VQHVRITRAGAALVQRSAQAVVAIDVRSSRIAAGVNAAATTRRSRVCTGASLKSMNRSAACSSADWAPNGRSAA
jgi:hypothetical protein